MEAKNEKKDIWDVLTRKQHITMAILVTLIALVGAIPGVVIVALMTIHFGAEYIIIILIVWAVIVNIPIYLVIRRYKMLTYKCQ